MRDPQDLRPIFGVAQDSRTVTDDECSEVCVEETEKIFRVADHVAGRMLVGRHGIELQDERCSSIKLWHQK